MLIPTRRQFMQLAAALPTALLPVHALPFTETGSAAISKRLKILNTAAGACGLVEGPHGVWASHPSAPGWSVALLDLRPMFKEIVDGKYIYDYERMASFWLSWNHAKMTGFCIQVGQRSGDCPHTQTCWDRMQHSGWRPGAINEHMYSWRTSLGKYLVDVLASRDVLFRALKES